jgi:hypothetical protein
MPQFTRGSDFEIYFQVDSLEIHTPHEDERRTIVSPLEFFLLPTKLFAVLYSKLAAFHVN